MAKTPSASTADKLRAYRDRIVRLEEEKKELSSDIKDIYAEAKSEGFDMRALRRVVKDSMMDDTQRAAQRETETISDLYRASLGMLDGTPLGEAARRRIEEPAEPRASKKTEFDGAVDEAAPSDGSAEAAAPSDQPDTNSEPTVDKAAEEEAAREQGRADHAGGRSILQNPYPAGDLRRAAWDEGWCDASGSDGMDVPEAWRRRSPKTDTPAEEKRS